MANQYLLSLGDGATADHISLNSGDYRVMRGSFDAPTPGLNDKTRTVTLGLKIENDTVDGMLAAYRALDTKLRQARLGARALGQQTSVTLGVQPDGATNMVYFDVLDGRVVLSRSAIQYWEQGFIGTRSNPVVLELICAPYARGFVYAPTGSPFTVTPSAPTFHINNVRGDTDGIVTYTVTDNATGQVVNRLIMAHKSQRDLDSGDFDGLYDLGIEGSASLVAGADAIGGDFVQLTSGSQTVQTWNDVASASAPAPNADQAGHYDIWARVADFGAVRYAASLDELQLIAGGSLPVGESYAIVVVPTSTTIETPMSNVMYATTSVSYRTIRVHFTPNPYNSSNRIRVYYNRGEGWRYAQITASGSPVDFSTETGAVTQDPPTLSTTEPVLWRAQIGMSSQVNMTALRPVASRIANSQWEWLKLGSAVPLPPLPLNEGGSVEPWEIVIQAFPPTARTVQADAIALLPTETTLIAEYPGLTLSTQRKYVFGSTRHGRIHGVLRSKSDDSEQGRINVIGQPALGPDDTTVVMLQMAANGVARVDDMSLSVAVSIVPRYRNVIGTV